MYADYSFGLLILFVVIRWMNDEFQESFWIQKPLELQLKIVGMIAEITSQDPGNQPMKEDSQLFPKIHHSL